MRILGVRHHSPACAALVGRVIRAARPAWVLIEGPVDFNARLSEFALGHQLPIALYSYHRTELACRACWSPFCDYSPEWVALEAGREVGAEVRFIDLPGWSRAFAERENRFSDRSGPDMAQMAERMGFDDTDRLWDSLFEQPRDDLEEALRLYFRELRAVLGQKQGGVSRGGDAVPPLGQVSDQDDAREACMASYLAWAQQQGGKVLVVCGGYHAPFLEDAWKTAAPVLPVLEEPGEVGNFLVPFSFARLDSFRGYQSGMPSPGYHQKVWEGGLSQAAARSLEEVAQRLRARKQTLSSADLIAAQSMAVGLARLRGHTQLSRTDLLDGLASSLLKEALEVDLPWSQRGYLPPGSDPMLVEIVAAFSGEKVGKLAAATPRPPLLADVNEQLRRLDLLPAKPARQVKLEILSQRARSACLHRLLMLAIPGFNRVAGPTSATRQALNEVWTLEDTLDREPALIEASHHGPDLESACLRFLEQALLRAEGAAPLAGLLSSALFADLGALSARALASIATAMRRETRLGDLGTALTILLEIFLHDRLLGGHGKGDLQAALEAGFGRGLWLFEGLLSEEPGLVQGLVAMRNLQRHPQLTLDRGLAAGLMQRASVDSHRAPLLRGAATGYLWTSDSPGAVMSQFSALPAASAADFLVGLLALAREEVLEDATLVQGLDERVRAWDQHDFLVALPALRLAFSTLPPQDKERLGHLLATLYGQTLAHNWLRLEVSPELVARGHLLEEQLDRRLQELKLA